MSQINGLQSGGSIAYRQQVQRTAWREEMLEQVLSKVRQVSPKIEAQPAKAGGLPMKGRLIDVRV
jgi:hypothetical protein